MSIDRGKYRAKADSLAIRYAKQNLDSTFENIREHVDISTGGELDCTQLDILTDMIVSRMKGAA